MAGWIDLGEGSPYWKSPAATASLLPASGNDPGDARVSQDTATIYVWNGTEWVSEAPGTGTVTSVGLTLPPNLFGVSGSPVTSNGNLTGFLTLQAASTIFAGPISGPNASPTFRNLSASDIPALPYQATGPYITSLAGDGTASGPGSSALTLSTVNSSPGTYGGTNQTLMGVVNAKGLLTSLSSATIQITESQVTNLISDLAGKQPTGSYITSLIGDVTSTTGGTATTTLATVNSAPGSYTYATVTVNAKGLITAASSGAAPTGTVTSVSLADATGLFTISGSPVTTSGTLAFSGLNSQMANRVFAAPNGSAGTPTFRALVAADIPALSYQAPGNYLTALTGDITAAGPGSSAATLATVNTNVGTFGDASHVSVVTVNAKGLTTAASSTSIQIAESQVANLTSDLAGKQPTGSYITALTGDGTAAGPGSAPFTLSTVNSNVGTFGTATSTSTVTLNSKGLVTAGSNTPIQITESQVTNLTSDLAGKQPTGNYLTALTGDVSAAGPGSSASTLATVNTAPGTYSYASVTVNAKGLVTAATSNAAPTGTVTSVALTAPSFLTVSGSPVTTNGTLSLALATQVAATVFAGPATGAAAVPTYRALATTDIPTLAYLSTTLGTANGLSVTGNTLALGVSSSTTTGALSSTDWATFNSKQAAGNYLTALTGDGTAAGPGSSALTLSSVNTSPGTFTYASLTVNAKGLVTAASSGAAPTGTVTSVSLADSTGLFNTVGSPVTTSGTLSLSSLKLQIANGVFAGPASGASAAPSFRALAVADIPALSYQAPGNYITALTGDATAAGPGSATLTLATVATAGTSPKVTYNAKGLVTSGTTLASADIPNNAANTTGTASNTTATSNSTLTSLPSLSLPIAQVTGIVPIAKGGTNLGTTPTNGQLLIGNGTGYTLNTLADGYGLTTTNGVGTITNAVVLSGLSAVATSSTTTSSGTDSVMTGMTITAPTAGTYLATFSCTINSAASGSVITVSMYNNGTQIPQTVRAMSPFAGGTLSATQASCCCAINTVVAVSGGNCTIEWHTSAGTPTAGVREFNLVRLF